MKLIERDYLKNLIDVIGSPDIKVITWVRRSGKSKLLWSFKDYVKNNITWVKNKSKWINLYKFD